MDLCHFYVFFSIKELSKLFELNYLEILDNMSFYNLSFAYNGPIEVWFSLCFQLHNREMLNVSDKQLKVRACVLVGQRATLAGSPTVWWYLNYKVNSQGIITLHNTTTRHLLTPYPLFAS